MAGNDDYCFDSNGPRIPRVQPSPRQGQVPGQSIIASKSPADIQRERDLAYITLLATAGDTVTEVTSPKDGDAVEDKYTELFKNNTNNPVRAQVFVLLTTPGAGIKLSTTALAGDQGLYDSLSLTANGRTEAVSIIVLPTMSIYMREFNSAFPMTPQDLIRVRIFDPAKIISYNNLYPKQLNGSF